MAKGGSQRAKKVSTLRFLVGMVILLPVLFLFIALSTGFYRAYRVISRSMEPTIKVGDHVLVSRSKGYMPKRGDIIAFELPSEPGQIITKRVIGVSGDTVTVKNGRVYLNSNEEEPNAFNQLLAGFSNYAVKLKEDQVFVLGDNRNQSFDSLDFGPLSYEQVYGKIIFRYWPLGRLGVIR